MALVVKNPLANAVDTGDVGSIPGSGRSPGGGHGNPLQFSCLENPMVRGAWRVTVHGVAKSQTQLKPLSMLAGHEGWALMNGFSALREKDARELSLSFCKIGKL